MRRRLGIGAKLIIIYLIIAIPGVITAATVYLNWYQVRIGRTVQERTEIARLTGTTFTLFVADIGRSMRHIGGIIVENQYSASRNTRELDKLLTDFPIEHAVLTDPRGIVVASTDRHLLGQNLSADPAFKDVISGRKTTAIEPVETGSSGTGFHVAQAIEINGGPMRAIAASFVSLSKLQQALPVRVASGSANIVDSNGRLVFMSNFPELIEKQPFWGKYDFVKTALSGKDAVSTDFISPATGRVNVISEVPIKEFGWAAGSSIDAALALEPIRGNVITATLVAALILLVALAISVYIARGILSSLSTLVKKARRVGEGHFDEPIELKTGDEIEDVAKSLNETRLNLKRYVEGLSNTVETGRSLTGTLELEDLKKAIIQSAKLAFAAESVWVFLLNENVGMLEPFAWSGPGTEKFPDVTYFEGEGPVGKAASTGEPIFVSEVRPELSIPLKIGEKTLGVLGISAPWMRSWSPTGREMELLEIFASQTSVAIENARLYEERKQVADEIRESRRQVLDILESITDAFFALDNEWRFTYINRNAERLLQRNKAYLLFRNIWDEFPELKNTIFYEEYSRAVSEQIPIAFEGFSKALNTWFEVHTYPYRGGLSVYFADITERKQKERLSETLNKIYGGIVSTLDYKEIMQRGVIESLTALGADGVAIIMRNNSRWTVEYAHGQTPEGTGTELIDGEARFVDIVIKAREPVAIRDANSDPRVDVELMKAFGIKSILAVPLLLRESVGILSFIFTSQQIDFTDAQVDFVNKLALSLSLALENARLYSSERNIANTLQAALLTVPPSISNLDFGYLYRPATEAARVGGDFFDLFETEQDIGIIIGDVSGKGFEAATLGSLTKNGIKAYMFENGSPAKIMAKTNNIIIESSPATVFVSVFFGILNKRTGRLTYCNAGHPPPLLKRKTSKTETLTVNSPIIGAFSNLHFFDDEVALEKGELLILYTDGVIEARCEKEFFGEDRLIDLTEELFPAKANLIPQAIFNQVASCTGGKLTDDVAILAISLKDNAISGKKSA